MDNLFERTNMIERNFDTSLHAMLARPQTEILQDFSPDQQGTIQRNLHVLSGLGFFIGKDFKIPIELNEPGEGWHWDFQSNIIRIDPEDLIERPMDELRFIISHEGAHRRVSRMVGIPQSTWNQPGFSFLMNAIEDPRVNTFLAKAYPLALQQMDLVYQKQLDFEEKTKKLGKDQLGFTPRFIQAGFEYIKQWFRETQGQPLDVSEDLPEDIKSVIQETLESAKNSWHTRPSKTGADGQTSEFIQDKEVTGEELITAYANASYVINRDEIWPRFKELVEKDMEDQKLQQLMQQMQQEGNGQLENNQSSQELKKKLTEEEQQALSDALDQAKQNPISTTDAPIDLDSLSEELKEKIKDYINSLPEDQRRSIEERARQSLQTFEEEVNKPLEGKLSNDPSKERILRESQNGQPESKSEESLYEPTSRPVTPELLEQRRQFQQTLAEIRSRDENLYEQMRRDVVPIITQLEDELRALFTARRAQGWQPGYRTGRKIDIKKRIIERAQGLPPLESRAWQRRELPTQRDYAVALLVDLTASEAKDGKVVEVLKSAIVLAEVLNRLSINTAIYGFNDRFYVYKNFGQNLNPQIREKMGGMVEEVLQASRGEGDHHRNHTDIGWATQLSSERLIREKGTEKFLITLTDGQPAESPLHPKEQYELGGIVSTITRDTNQRLIGLGLGPGTDHVKNYYPYSIGNIRVKEMAEQLADVLRQIIENPQNF